MLTILICTHNRRDLLARTIASLNHACRPLDTPVRMLVMANACTDDTLAWLADYACRAPADGRLPLSYADEPAPGKSQALNTALSLIDTPWTTFVDDDHRVDGDYLRAVADAFQDYPDAGLFCGRILPDWDATEPHWVHDEGPHRIYPLPVPRFELGESPLRVAPGTATPGGGNLAVRTELFSSVGNFLLDFGPHGHDLGGAEDIEWVKRAMALGHPLQYVPRMLQYHFVDGERLRLGYLMRKSFQRSSSMIRLSPDIGRDGRAPRYMYRKAIAYAFDVAGSLSAGRRRFYLVRLAAALGEIDGAHKRKAIAPSNVLAPEKGPTR